MTNFTKLIFCLFAILFIFTSCGDGSNTPISDEPKFEESVLTSIQVKTLPNKTEYAVAESFDATGLVLKATYTDYYSDESTKTSTRDISYAEFKDEIDFFGTDFSTSGTKSITVTYNGKSTSFEVTVRNNSVNSSEYASWFQEATIGGENSNICPMYVTEYSVNENNKLTTESVNNILDQYKKYVNNLNLDTTLSDGQIDFEAIKALTGANEPKKLDILISNINNVCAPAITEITKNIGVSDNKAFDKDKFNIYYWAIANEVYKYTCGTSFDSCGKAYYEEQKGDLDSYSIIGCWAGIHDDNGITPDFNIYNNDGTLNEKVINELDEMVDAAVTRFNNQGKNITKKDVYNKLNLSWTTNAIKGLHDDLCEVNALGNDIIDHTASEACKDNEMVNTIGNVQSSEMTS